MMIDRINYIHNNPVKWGYVDGIKHWKYSSARNYESILGFLEAERTMGTKNKILYLNY